MIHANKKQKLYVCIILTMCSKIIMKNNMKKGKNIFTYQ